MMDCLYYRVNPKKKLIHFDNTSLAQAKSSLFYDLSTKNESSIYNQIVKIFNSLLKKYQNKNKDKLFIINALIEDYKKLKNIQLENYDKISFNICKKLSETDYKMCLNFDSENINDICMLLALSFTKLFNTNKKKYKTYESLKAEIESYRTIFVDFKKIYKAYNYSLPLIVPEIPKNTIPNEMLLLMDVMQGIKRLNLYLKNYNKESLIPYLIILLNYDWLFPFVFEIDLDLSFEQFTNDIEKLYYQKEKNIYIKNRRNEYIIDESDNVDTSLNDIVNLNLIKKDIKLYNKNNIIPIRKESIKKNNNNINNRVNNAANSNNRIFNGIGRPRTVSGLGPMQVGREISKIEENYIKILKNNNNVFDVLFCFHYLIKEVKYLKTISIKLPNGFIKENIDLIKMKNIPDINAANINLFEYISLTTSLNTLKINFNSLEKLTFENVLYLFQNNANIRELRLNFFPDDNKTLTSENLIKIADECGVCNKILTSNRDKLYLPIITNNEKIIKQKLLEMFSTNLEKLFLLLQTKKNMEIIELIINLPLILYDNEGYHWTILKLLFNIIILLQKEKFDLKEFKLILPFFNLDNRQFPIIGEFLDTINLNTKNKFLKIFHFQASIQKLYNIKNLISYNLVSLNIGEIDLYTFKAFVDFYQSEEFLEKSQLKNLCIEFNKTIIKYKECKNDLNNFFSGKNPQYLTEISFKCYFHIKKKKLNELFLNCNGNKIEKYNIIMKVDNLQKYNKIINHNIFYYLNDDINQKINKYLSVLKKCNFINDKNKNIAKKIIKSLVPSNAKKINISNIS